ncbi:MAG: hypothetical protein L6Q37_11350 [Bdellovibrionaceae bacterium]|nr:hypothetical protein [Pseudobdellovibrionaceae bacterium]NUM58266.1 hypothetical protein [Pseudobdellovibrionaceae bacterium]
MKTFFFVLSLFSILASIVKADQLQIPNYVGQKMGSYPNFSHPVVYQSSKALVSKDQKTATVKMVTRWGTEVYEIGVAVFTRTNVNKKFSFSQWQSLATYGQCAIGKDKSRFVCSHKSRKSYSPRVNGSIGAQLIESYEQEIREDRTSQNYDGVEFPERGNAYWEYSVGDL